MPRGEREAIGGKVPLRRPNANGDQRDQIWCSVCDPEFGAETNIDIRSPGNTGAKNKSRGDSGTRRNSWQRIQNNAFELARYADLGKLHFASIALVEFLIDPRERNAASINILNIVCTLCQKIPAPFPEYIHFGIKNRLHLNT